jgi:hypothetical protein
MTPNADFPNAATEMMRDSLTPKLGVCIKANHPCKAKHEADVPSQIGLTPMS